MQLFQICWFSCSKCWGYSHKKEASTDVVGNWTHPDVAVFLQILRCDHCLKERHVKPKWSIFIALSSTIIVGCISTAAVVFGIIQNNLLSDTHCT